jgi:phosphoribosyl 1,2-cyclic phosphodiesterase
MLRYRKHATHLSVDEALNMAERIGATRTWFTHMTHDILHADLDPRLPEGMALAFDGLVIGEGSDAATKVRDDGEEGGVRRG